MNNFERIAAACRYNSGTHFLDSGGSNGRHWQREGIKSDSPSVWLDLWRHEISATISTAHFLEDESDIDKEITSAFEEWHSDKEGSWFELVPEFLEEMGFDQYARDNTYNTEHDLSQDYIWEVWAKEDQGDWIYNNEAVFVCFIHTGADIRGGYSSPLFLRSNGDYSVPLNLVAEFFISDGRRDGETLEHEELQDLSDKWQSGYSSHPSYQMNKDIARVFHFTKTVDSVCALLKTGEVVKITAAIPYN